MAVLVSKWNRSCCRYKFLFPRVYDKVLRYFSTATVSSSPSSSSSDDKHSSLYKRISIAGDPRVSMTCILDQWVSEGHQIHTDELRTLLTRLRHFKRFTHALQVSVWMSEKQFSNLSLKDVATQLELVLKVHGLDHAEKYFVNLPELLRGPVVYSGLLNCYVGAKFLKKAEDLMQKMKKLGFAKVSVPYNAMLKMYFQLEMYDKVQQTLQEMEEKGFSVDTFSDRIQLTAYSKSGKIKEMEMVLMKMEADPHNTMKYFDYLTAANGYLKVGAVDKSLVTLRRAERLGRGLVKKHVCHCLLTLYAHAKAKEEVFRVWNLYKRSWEVYNRGYLCMVNSLVILDDLEEAEKIVDEWAERLSADRKVDFQVINPLIHAYCKRGDFERAQKLIEKLREKSSQEPPKSTWDILATGFP